MVRIFVMAVAIAFTAFATPVSAQVSEKAKVVFFFDTEDFIQPRSSDAIRDIANILASEGIKGHFAMVGYLGKKLVDWRRFDVIDALKAHHVGTQTLYHSLHPNITESTDIEDFDAAYRHALDEESRGIGMLMAATGKEKMWCSVLPGNGNTIVGLYLYADLGIPFFGGGTGMYEDVTKCGDYQNANAYKCLAYAAIARCLALPIVPACDLVRLSVEDRCLVGLLVDACEGKSANNCTAGEVKASVTPASMCAHGNSSPCARRRFA